MNTQTINKLIDKIAQLSKQKVNPIQLKDNYQKTREYSIQELNKFVDELTYKGQRAGFTFLLNYLSPTDIEEFLENITFPVLFFHQHSEENIEPLLVYRDEGDNLVGQFVDSGQRLRFTKLQELRKHFLIQNHAPDPKQNGQIIFVTSFPVTYLADQPISEDSKDQVPPTPLRRLLNLLGTERSDITYIYVYAIVVGLISLVLPLGIQAMIRLISGGMIFSSVVVIITVVIVGLMASGALQIMQITLVEILQQRIFAKAAFEFTYRVPKIRLSALAKYYPPELMNRFFDVVIVQKSLPKLLVDLTGAVLQILFGLILLSFYHPFFLAFSVLLIGSIALIFRLTGPKGLKTSLTESKYKYKIVYWLEEIARNIHSFRLAGDTSLHMQKMDDFVSNYLYYRKSHFSVLRTQLIYIVIFKVLVIGGLLVLGTLLVVDRQITLGQFVASEIVVVLVVAAVEKIIVSMDNIYDLLTSVEKIGTVTDLPLEQQRGNRIEITKEEQGLEIAVKDLKYPNAMGNNPLEGVTFKIKPGEKVALAGMYAAGKHTMARLLAGVMTDYEGSITYNNISLREIHPHSLRTVVDNYLFNDALFEGTILENVAMGRSGVQYEDVHWALEKVGLDSYVNKLPEGVYTNIGAEGKRPSESVGHKILLARSISSRPKLLIIKDSLPEMCRFDRTQLLEFMTSRNTSWTLVAVSNDPMLLAKCDRILVFESGKVVAEGPYKDLENHPVLKEAILQE